MNGIFTKKLNKTFDQKLTNPIQNVIRIGFLSIFYIPAGGIFKNNLVFFVFFDQILSKSYILINEYR